MAKRALSILALLFGILGIIACVAVFIASWSLTSRINRATDGVFAGIDHVLEHTQQQLATAQARVVSLKLSTEDISTSVKAWGEKEVADRLGSDLQIEKRITQLESSLFRADEWLETIESSVEFIQQNLESARTLGIAIRATPLEDLQNEIVAVRETISGAAGPLARIGEQATGLRDEETGTERASQIAQTTARLIATFGKIDTRIAALDGGVSEVRDSVGQAEERVFGWIRLMTLAVTFLTSWMAAGQASLVYLGLQGWKQSRMTNS